MRSGLAARIAFQIVQRQKLVALRSGADVVDVLYPVVVSLPEVFQDTSPAAHDDEPHDLRVILIFPQLRKDGIGILFRCLLHDGGVCGFRCAFVCKTDEVLFPDNVFLHERQLD